MKSIFQRLFFSAALVLFAAAMVIAQEPPAPEVTEAGTPEEATPRDGIYDREIIRDRLILPYDHIREADVFWEKRVWRIIDVREKINLPFIYPKAPFITIVLDAAEAEDISLYSTVNDEFTKRLTTDEVKSLSGTVDTVIVLDDVTYEEKIKLIPKELNVDDVKRYRLKEVWFFDEETARMEVRILGIAPMLEKNDNNGNFMFEYPMFWAYYPEVRTVLARNEAFNPYNDAQRMSWEDIFEMRMFSSYIMKSSNVYNRAIKDYKAGLDILLESEKLHQEIFNFEQDLWMY